jgi:N6-adenosine-specific RNA methylase IME4
MRLPAPYLKAKAALAEVVSFVEAKDIHDKAMGMEVYAMHAKDADLASEAVSVKKWAERKIGELIAADREAGRLARGAREPGTQRGTTRGAENPASLADQGVDKELAKRSRNAFAMSENDFLAYLEKACKRAVAAAEGNRAALNEERVEIRRVKAARRAEREAELGAKQRAMPEQRFGVIYADPPWRFEPYSRETGMDRAADNHYPTDDLTKIADLAVPAADDCVLFLWATVPMLTSALFVMHGWGFSYKSHFIWVKDKIGTGYWNRNKHELLLIGTRGNIPAPAPGYQYESVIPAPIGEHSAKPVGFRQMIEELYPTLPKLEMFARGGQLEGWTRWGLEAEPAEAAE